MCIWYGLSSCALMVQAFHTEENIVKMNAYLAYERGQKLVEFASLDMKIM